MSFFFSSRRRHTRWNCDWSSDVCSSDLTRNGSLRLGTETAGFAHTPTPSRGSNDGAQSLHQGSSRSEERRVGKERRARRCPRQKNQRAAEKVADRTERDHNEQYASDDPP